MAEHATADPKIHCFIMGIVSYTLVMDSITKHNSMYFMHHTL